MRPSRWLSTSDLFLVSNMVKVEYQVVTMKVVYQVELKNEML